MISLCSVDAQIGKGSILAGGNLGYGTSSTQSGGKEHIFNISPSIGIAVSNNTILGASFRYGFYDTEASNDQLNLGTGIFLRKYKSLGKGFYLFGQGDLGFDYRRYEQVTFINPSYDTHITRSYIYRLGFNPGISYALTNRLQLELMFTDFISASYSKDNKESSTGRVVAEPETKRFSVNSNISLNSINSLGVGIRFLLNRTK